MGRKGDKMTAASTAVTDSIVECLRPLGEVTGKKMFGGYGGFEQGTMFALVDSRGQFFLKVDDSNRKDFEDVEAVQHGRMPYFSVPEEVQEDDRKLRSWALKSMRLSKK